MEELIEEARRKSARRVIRARYSGICDACRQPVSVGDLVCWRAGTRVTHERCWVGEREARP